MVKFWRGLASSDGNCQCFISHFSLERSVVDDAPAPRDASDLRRCVLFLEQTGTTGRIGEAAAMSPAWAAITPRWEELLELLALAMAEEAPSQSSRAINAILQDADAPRPRASQGPK